MTILSWNCRGVAATATMNELRELCKHHQPVVLFLMETKAPKERIRKIQQSLKFQASFCVESRGLSGGLALFWNDNISVQILNATPNYIHTSLCYKQGGGFFDCTFVYGHPQYQQRRNFWPVLAGFQPNRDSPWCSIGDFNEMLVQSEKSGLGPFNQGRADLFKDFLNSTGLMELDQKGCKFTWASNPRSGVIVREKLDRALGNWPWRRCFPHAVITALPMVSSDHSPLIFHPMPKSRSGKSFKFEAFWDAHPDCNRVVQDGWHESEVCEDSWSNLQGKLKSCKNSLVRWQKKVFRRADEQIVLLKDKLKLLQDQGDQLTDDREVKRL